MNRKKPDRCTGVEEDGGAEGDEESGEGPSRRAEDKDGEARLLVLQVSFTRQI